VLPYVPDSDVKGGLISALALPGDAAPRHAARILGNGSRVSCMDTVPFAVWCAARCLDSYEEAIWQAAGVGGDVDTNCAIVGGIVAVYTGAEAIPSGWCAQREPLPAWAFDAQGD
jgi:ADP-ribosylglycohydrolase